MACICEKFKGKGKKKLYTTVNMPIRGDIASSDCAGISREQLKKRFNEQLKVSCRRNENGKNIGQK